jgi:P-type Cu+ transporter
MECQGKRFSLNSLLIHTRLSPENVKESIKSLSPLLIIEPEPIFSTTRPVLRVTYTPTFPGLTIRTILTAITSSDQALKVDLVQEATVEERAEILRHKEQRTLLIRLIVSFVFSIPTFIFGIVFMSLLPSQSSIRQYFNHPIWAGNVSRTTWILFFLSTPIEFLVADVFHRKALQEIKALWRPGSQTPIYQRFFRFGSMNLLVSFSSKGSSNYRCHLGRRSPISLRWPSLS